MLWQTPPEDDTPEGAILIERFATSFNLQQEDNRISVNYESIPDLIKVLKTALAEYKSESV